MTVVPSPAPPQVSEPAALRPPPAPKWAWAAALAVAVSVVAALAPTMTWLEFSSGSENLNIATALEVRRDDQWLIPTLQGEPRVQKPPLTAWLTALAITDATMDGISSPDALERSAAATSLAWQARWPAAAAVGLIVLAIYATGAALDGWRFGLIAAAVVGSMLLTLRYGRFASTDVQLALWVTVTNALLALAVIREWLWRGLVLGGLALGLALLSKGPVALLQTVLPICAFIAWRHSRSDETRWGRAVLPVAAGAAVAVIVGLGWFAVVLLRSGTEPVALLTRWWVEVSREGATEGAASPWHNYAVILPLAFPWIVFLVVGLILGARELWARSREPLVLAILLLLVPLLAMSLFRDREARYLLPLAGPAALVAAWGLSAHLHSWRRWGPADTICVSIHWVALAIVAVGLPIAGALGPQFMQRADGSPWYPPTFAAVIATAEAGLIVLGVLLHRRWRGGLIAATVVAMLLLQAVVIEGYRHSREGRSEMKPLAEAIWSACPDAIVVNAQAKRVPSDLSIYLNRIAPSVPDGWSLVADRRPLVLIVYQHRGTSAPTAAAGWTPLATVQRDRNAWHAFVRWPAGR